MAWKTDDVTGDFVDDGRDLDGNPTGIPAKIDNVDVSALNIIAAQIPEIEVGDTLYGDAVSSIGRLPIGNKDDVYSVAESGVARVPKWKRPSIVRTLIFGGV